MTTALRFPAGIDSERFLRNYWQRQPLLLPDALPPPTLDPEELAGLACEPEVESRLILGNETHGWRLRHGPFDEADFAALPARDWTLLVQDVDKWLPAFARLIDAFRFLPDWRIDDVMVSYAPEGGSVGPHIDSYDVFLLQLAGEREWRISDQRLTDPPLRDDSDPRVMRAFAADRQWRLRPGDLLYLPPGVPHWGIGRGDGCMTGSIGFRAPDGDELLAAASTWLSEHPRPRAPYHDPPLAGQAHPALLNEDAFLQLRGLLERALSLSDDELRAAFARRLTEPKPGFEPVPPRPALTRTAFVERLKQTGRLYRHPAARFLYYPRADGGATLWVDGEALETSALQWPLLRLLAGQALLELAELAPWLEEDDDTRLLHALYRRGIHAFEA